MPILPAGRATSVVSAYNRLKTRSTLPSTAEWPSPNAILATAAAVSARVIQTAPAADWRQTQSYGVRLGVAPTSAGDKQVTATFAIQGPGLDGLQSRTDRQLQPGKFTYLFFPDDFHRKPLPGRYLWTCRVGDKVVAQGEFVFASPSKEP